MRKWLDHVILKKYRFKKNTLRRQILHYKYNVPLLPTKKNSNSFADVERCKDSQLLRQWTFCLYIYCIYTVHM